MTDAELLKLSDQVKALPIAAKLRLAAELVDRKSTTMARSIAQQAIDELVLVQLRQGKS